MQGIESININSDMFSNIIDNNYTNKNLNKEQPIDDSKIKFGDVISQAINKVNGTQVEANNMVEALIKGEDVSMHDVMLSMQESQISMQLMLETRNKLFEAYKELSGVQL
ncbi:flagellar hook-basal body complex protein FliE [Terrisporobacter hibernicus]|uniref:Flagellar hook-basal body complex protein FliE n=1 Tax=Terrisporobacter hibernicus TaxID=2813371 RepID=A0AAX2ZGV3_9FIRM|nr:flagellar hook-basal body complex protein FliE [Terrisporobacter hibernicus]UEL48563.1 flagellar hook-basal body complex protein FliE [Terrisporobacter hibernicus]UPA31427.1 flagellar hook-basal body complex protein FliE [Terrisporobacter glycolicus]